MSEKYYADKTALGEEVPHDAKSSFGKVYGLRDPLISIEGLVIVLVNNVSWWREEALGIRRILLLIN